MARSNTLETGYLKLLYQNVDLANIGDATGLRGSTTAGNFYAALFVTNPTDADIGTEASYTGYARVPIVRTVSGFTVSGNVVSNAVQVLFPTNTGSTQTVFYVGVMTASSGGDLMHHGVLGSALETENGDAPKFEIGNFTVTAN